ncbi:MAG: hypothetical protein VB859_03890 [Planctomycetaceae bacterium]
MAFDKLKGHLSNAQTAATEAASAVVQSGGDKLNEKLAKTMQELSALRSFLKQGGFNVRDILLTASIPPGLGLVVEQEQAGVDRLSQVEEENELTTLQSTVIGQIRRIQSLEKLVQRYDHTIAQIRVELTVPPKVTAHLQSTTNL